MSEIALTIESEAQTEQLGRLLARHLPVGSTVCLSGTLGAGKTRLVQAIATECDVPRKLVVSPTFTLCNEYAGDVKIQHLDLYRIVDEDELFELGIEEYFASPGLTIIEWADRFTHYMPAERLDIALEVTGETTRIARFRPFGPELEATVEQLTANWPP